MSRFTAPLFCIAIGLLASLPAQAWQQQGGGQRSGMPPGGQRGMMMQGPGRMDDGSPMYGWQLMTPAERDAYRSKMRSLTTSRERQELRTQHHQEMQERAKQRGMTLPDMPPMGGRMRGGRQGMQQQQQQNQQNQQQPRTGQQESQQNADQPH